MIDSHLYRSQIILKRTASLAIALASLILVSACTSTVPTKVGTKFTPKLEASFVDAETAARLRDVDVVTHKKKIKVGFDEATVEIIVETVQDPHTSGAFVRSVVVVVSANDAWDISAALSGDSLNRGTHEKPLEGVAVLVTAINETTWSKRLTQTMVDVSGNGTISVH